VQLARDALRFRKRRTRVCGRLRALGAAVRRCAGAGAAFAFVMIAADFAGLRGRLAVYARARRRLRTT
ncbi:MAG: hypothetical protein AAGL49_07395, partial [Pseudomonadota bacterium]